MRKLCRRRQPPPPPGPKVENTPRRPASGRLAEDQAYLEQVLAGCGDVVFRRIHLGADGRPALLVFHCTLADSRSLQEHVLEPLLAPAAAPAPPGTAPAAGGTGRQIPVGNLNKVADLDEVVSCVLRGKAALLLEGSPAALVVDLAGGPARAVEEPAVEQVIRGPREGFNEILDQNIALLRRRFPTPALKVEKQAVGRLSQTGVALVYLDGIASPEILDEVRRRLAAVDFDAIIDSSMLEEFIEDQSWSPFPQARSTERPDVVAAQLAEGQVAVLTAGAPSALLVPATLWGLLHPGEDYYQRFLIASLLRWVRYVLLIISITLPAFYVAVTSFHQEMLPTRLLYSVAGARERTPFPVFLEVFLMEFFMEGLREAGVRMPRNLGQSVSIVGSIVIGLAAVQAGLVSAPVVIVVALTAIAGFTISNYSLALALRLLRFPLIALAAVFGIVGLFGGVAGIVIHLAGLKSFGVPYLAPVAPRSLPQQQDILFRAPWWAMKERPTLVTRAREKQRTRADSRRGGETTRPAGPRRPR